MILGLQDPDPDPLGRGTDPDLSLFLIKVLSGICLQKNSGRILTKKFLAKN
jgi:hypothetical protein